MCDARIIRVYCIVIDTSFERSRVNARGTYNNFERHLHPRRRNIVMEFLRFRVIPYELKNDNKHECALVPLLRLFVFRTVYNIAAVLHKPIDIIIFIA